MIASSPCSTKQIALFALLLERQRLIVPFSSRVVKSFSICFTISLLDDAKRQSRDTNSSVDIVAEDDSCRWCSAVLLDTKMLGNCGEGRAFDI